MILDSPYRPHPNPSTQASPSHNAGPALTILFVRTSSSRFHENTKSTLAKNLPAPRLLFPEALLAAIGKLLETGGLLERSHNFGKAGAKKVARALFARRTEQVWRTKSVY
jgi:hypothetical protein